MGWIEEVEDVYDQVISPDSIGIQYRLFHTINIPFIIKSNLTNLPAPLFVYCLSFQFASCCDTPPVLNLIGSLLITFNFSLH